MRNFFENGIGMAGRASGDPLSNFPPLAGERAIVKRGKQAIREADARKNNLEFLQIMRKSIGMIPNNPL
jgi:hypothetical protein